MNTLTIDLENCYGIKKLKTTLDFSAATTVCGLRAKRVNEDIAGENL